MPYQLVKRYWHFDGYSQGQVLHHPENKGTEIFWNRDNFSPLDTVQRTDKHQSPAVLLWEPQALQLCTFVHLVMSW